MSVRQFMKLACAGLANPRLGWASLKARLRGLRRGPTGCDSFRVGPLTIPYIPGYDVYMHRLATRSHNVPLQVVMDRYLAPGATFIDVGAHIGIVTAEALLRVGNGGAVHAFEPAPATFAKLQAFAQANPEQPLHVNQAAVGAEAGSAQLTLSRASSAFATLVEKRLAEDDRAEQVGVPVVTLSEYLAEREVADVALIKIDTEGHEVAVLQGLRDYLARAGRLPVIICEVIPDTYPVGGKTVADLAGLIGGLGYESRSMLNPRRRLDPQEMTRGDDLLLLPRK